MPHAKLTKPTETQETSVDLATLCRNALRSDDPSAMQAFRKHVREIRNAKNEEDIREALRLEMDEEVPLERIADLFDAFAEAAPGSPQPIETREDQLAASLNEEAVIGHTFAEHLLYNLDRRLKRLDLVFAKAPGVSAAEQRELYQTPSVAVARRESAGLVACGLTPLSVLDATTSVFPLAKRLGLLGSPDPLILCYVRRSWLEDDAPPASAVEFSRGVVREVHQILNCSETTAEILIDWLIDVARQKRLVFRGAEATGCPWGVVLTENEDFVDSLKHRWRGDLESADAESPEGVDATENAYQQ